jgi:hypothetical protein
VVASHGGGGVTIVRDPSDPIASAGPSLWAAGQLKDSFTARGIKISSATRMGDADPADICLVVTGPPKESLVLASAAAIGNDESLTFAATKIGDRQALIVAGGGVRGIVYGLTELADAINYAEGDPMAVLQPAALVAERPANPIRSVIRLFCSDVEDKAWFNDRGFWQRYLTMLVSQRFNRFNLSFGLGYDFATNLLDTYLYFAYPFLVKVPGYNVRAVGLPDAERDQNLAMLRYISDTAATRGLQFQLGLWTHAYQWNNSPNVNYTIDGLTADKHAAYCRDALAIILRECPNITGVTFRVHGESGVAEGSYDFWKTVFDAVAKCGRHVEIDMHAKGMDQGMIDTALATRQPIVISPKFWAEHCGLPYHQAYIRPNEIPAPNQRGGGLMALSSGQRSFLRYGYGDLLREDRKYDILHRVWPGTQRFLLWGDPAFAAGYSRAFQFCGSAGGEYFDPMGFKGRKGSGLAFGRQGYADAKLRTADDFEKHLYTYRLLGRTLYNPNTSPDIWQQSLRAEFGETSAAAVEQALAPASRILPLVTTAHCPSAANNNYWPEMYVNMPIVGTAPREPYGDTPKPPRFGTVSPLDPQLFSRIEDFADELLTGKFSGKYSPLDVARWLQAMAFGAITKLSEARGAVKDVHKPSFRRLEVDVRVQAGLGQFFAYKMLAGVLFALYQRTGQETALKRAQDAYASARQAWDSIITATNGVYVSDITYGIGWFQRGNWADRLAAIDQDIAAMAAPSTQPALANVTADALDAAINAAMAATAFSTRVKASHAPANTFKPGEAVELAVSDCRAGEPITSVQLYCRHVNQAEAWINVPMDTTDRQRFSATIPREYTAILFPLQYYFQFIADSGRAWLYPGLGGDLMTQPYFVLRPA